MKIIEIVDGDYYSRPNDHVILPDGMDIDAEYALWKAKCDDYDKALERGEDPDYMDFPNWLVEKRGARVPTDDELGVWSET